MIDFNCDIDLNIKYYTTSEFVIKNFKPNSIKRVLIPEDADILILDSESDNMEMQYNSRFVFSVDYPIDGCRAVISKANIVAYLNMLDRMKSEDYFVGMVDYLDIMRVSGGKLVHYGRYELNESEDEIYASLPQELTNESVGIIVTVSKKDDYLLRKISGEIDLMYPNGSMVIMRPAQESQITESFLEVYVFESTVEEPIWT